MTAPPMVIDEQPRLALRHSRPAAFPNPGLVRRAPRFSAGFWLGGLVVLLLVCTALFGPLLAPVSPDKQDLLHRLAPPVWAGGTAAHPLGTDSLGRDQLARLIAGARVSLLIGLTASLGAGCIGVVLGVLAAWAPRPVHRVVNWLIDVQSALPFVVIAIAATATMGNSLRTVLLVLIFTGWVGYARVTDERATALRNATWVDAARALGASDGALIVRHVAPMMVGPIIILATQQVSAMILYEAALSYLGLGVGNDVITWGAMAAAGQSALFKAPWVTIVPGAAVLITVIGFTLLGDALATRRPGGAPGSIRA